MTFPQRNGNLNQPSMADLLEEATPLRELHHGEVVHGQIMRVDQDSILVSVGNKSEGVVPAREMRSVDAQWLAKHQVGSSIPVYVVDPTGHEGQALLSIDRARVESGWETLEARAQDGKPLTARVAGHNRGGLIVDVEGLQAFVPLSQAVVQPGRDQEAALQSRVGEEITLKVLEVSRRRNRAVLSEREAMKEQREAGKDKLLDTLQEGETRHGQVTGVSSFGAFVDLGGADGLIHISELSWLPVTSVEEVVSVGQEVDVYILRIDRENRRIALSLRRLAPTPWDLAASKFETGQLVTGTITKLTDFGAFARVEDMVEGLIHVSELSDRHVRHPKEVVQVGDTLTLRIVTLDPERRRLGLSLKQVEEYEPA